MIEIIKELSVEVTKPNIFQALVAKQYDMNTRFLKVTLMDCGTRIDVPAIETAKVVINAERKDGQSKGFDGVINDDGTVTVPLHSWMLELDGTVICDISVIDTATDDNKKLTTTSFTLLVEKAAYGGDDITSDPQYDVLVTLLAAVPAAQEALDKSNEALEISNEANSKYEACVEATENANKVREEIEAGGYIASLKEMNNGDKFSVWIGTTEEYNNILYKIPNCLYILTDEENFLNKTYPVGSVYIANNPNVNPATKFGGTWELFDKGYANVSGSDEPEKEGAAAELTYFTLPDNGNTTACTTYFSRSGSTVRLRLAITSETTFTDSGGYLGKINFEKLGFKTMPFGYNYILATTDYANGGLMISINWETGEVNALEVIGGDTISSYYNGKYYPYYADVTFVVTPERMLADFCDKFYWKRTA